MRRILVVLVVALALGMASGTAEARSGTSIREYRPPCQPKQPCGIIVRVNGEQILPPPIGP